MNNLYDFIVVGAGISGCTFASSINKRFPQASILLVENGRRIGGRSTTRKSRKNLFLEFDHGLPSFTLNNSISHDLFSLISPLIKSRRLIDISNDILLMNEFGFLNKQDIDNKTFRCFPYMINFSKEIINQSINPKKINFLFETLIKSIIRNNDFWEVKINNEEYLRAKNLVLSSSLLAHPRCLKILNINSIPLRDAFKIGRDNIVDSVIEKIVKQEYIKRKNYIMYVPYSKIVKNIDFRHLQIFFSKVITNKFSYERIIFQRQIDGSIVIVLHCCYYNKPFDNNFGSIIQSLKQIFYKQKKFLDLFIHAQLIDKMDWRASQPLNNLLPNQLQWSSVSKIGFCGDWFEFKDCERVEAAMNSAIKLSKMITQNDFEIAC